MVFIFARSEGAESSIRRIYPARLCLFVGAGGLRDIWMLDIYLISVEGSSTKDVLFLFVFIRGID